MQKNSNNEEKGQGLRYEVSTESREIAQSHMGILPPRFQTDVMLEILVRTLYDGRFRQEFRANPRDLMNEAGLSIPSSVMLSRITDPSASRASSSVRFSTALLIRRSALETTSP